MTVLQRRARGARARHNNKLNEAQVRTLRQEYREGIRRKAPSPTMKELGAMYGISEDQVKRIVARHQWKDVA